MLLVADEFLILYETAKREEKRRKQEEEAYSSSKIRTWAIRNWQASAMLIMLLQYGVTEMVVLIQNMIHCEP